MALLDVQEIPVKGELKVTTAPTAANVVNTPGLVEGGTHSYKVTFLDKTGESAAGPKSNVVTVDGDSVTIGDQNGQVDLTGIPTGPPRTTARRIYRTVTGDAGAAKLLTTINDNTTTVFRDNISDAALGVDAPTTNTAEAAQPSFVAADVAGDEAAIGAGHFVVIKNDNAAAITVTLRIPVSVSAVVDTGPLNVAASGGELRLAIPTRNAAPHSQPIDRDLDDNATWTYSAVVNVTVAALKAP